VLNHCFKVEASKKDCRWFEVGNYKDFGDAKEVAMLSFGQDIFHVRVIEINENIVFNKDKTK